MNLLVEVDRLENENSFFIMKIDNSEESRTKREIAEDIARKNYCDFFAVTLKELTEDKIDYFKVNKIGQAKKTDSYE